MIDLDGRLRYATVYQTSAGASAAVRSSVADLPKPVLAIARQASIDIVSQGKNTIAVNMMSDGNWAVPPEMLEKRPGYGKVADKQAETRKFMENKNWRFDDVWVDK